MRNRWVAPLAIIAMTLFGFAVFGELPDRIDSHWNASGEADGTMSRVTAVLFMPALTIGIWLLMVFIPRIDPRRRNYAAFAGTYQLFINVIVLFMAGIQIVILGNGLGWNVPVSQAIMVGIGLLFAIIGNELGRLKPNWFAGIRTPWTLSDDEVWRRTHRVGGRVFFVLGILTAVVAIFAPPLVTVIFLLAGHRRWWYPLCVPSGSEARL